MNFFCQNNQRKISSWEATGKIRATLKSAMMKAGCCLTRGAVEELVELQADLDELSPTRRDALRTVISDIEFELPRFLTFVGSKGAESVTRFASEPLTKYRQLFRANGDISPLGNRCLFLLAQVRESSRLAIDLVKRSPNPNASGHAKGKAIRCCKKAIRDV